MIFMKTQSNFYLFLIALISAMGGFLFGYDCLPFAKQR